MDSSGPAAFTGLRAVFWAPAVREQGSMKTGSREVDPITHLLNNGTFFAFSSRNSSVFFSDAC